MTLTLDDPRTTSPATGARHRSLGWVKVVLPPVVAIGLLAALLPRAAGTSWDGITSTLLAVRPYWLPVVVVVWLLGLWVQTAVQTAALPGLTSRRALLLNATGSAISNVAPFGGALGIEANRRMVRRWGVDGAPFASYVVLTNVVQLVTKLVLPVVVLALALVTGTSLGPVAALAWTALAMLVALVAVLAARAPAVLADAVLRRAVAGVQRLRHHPAAVHRATPVLDLRAQCRGLLARSPARIVLATTGYLALHALGLAIALHAVGAGVGVLALLAALATERAASLMLVTPAGAGIAEVAAAVVLVHFGVAPAAAAAGLLLHRLIIVGLEVPLGGLLGGLWWWRARPAVTRQS